MRNMEKKEPRGIRNNNPLNIRYSKNNEWVGRIVTEKQDLDFEEFAQMMWGYRAAFILLKNYMEQGHNTIEKIIKKWAPAKENNTQKYIETVCKHSGLSRDEEINFLMPCLMIPLVKAMAYVECGSTPAIEDLHKGYRCVVEKLNFRVLKSCLDRCCPVPNY